MIYYQTERDGGDLYLKEPGRDTRYNKKTETVFAQCNGTFGVRASWETRQLEEDRGIFVGGLYHRAGAHEVSELIHGPDITEFSIAFGEQPFYMDHCVIHECYRKLNLTTGELSTGLRCEQGDGKEIRMTTQRFASVDNTGLFCHRLRLSGRTVGEAAAAPETVTIATGINSRPANSGVSHYEQVLSRVFDRNFILSEHRCDDGQILKVMTVCAASREPADQSFQLERRKISGLCRFELAAEEPLVFSKYTLIDTGRLTAGQMKEQLEEAVSAGYEALYSRHREQFQRCWDYGRIRIGGATEEEEAAIAFAQYHLLGMVPKDTHAYSVAAKGLTGEGYRGHVFWDTELFVMPYFTLVFPEISRHLLRYRYERLDGARKKAADYGFQGAMFPWESAATGAEETPLTAALNIHTGKAENVWSGIKEHHVTADIVLGLWHYYQTTNDEQFMERYGDEIIFEAARFWYSRAVFNETHGRFEILDIIGPDEYTEHVDNNTYTNYMAHETVRLALERLFVSRSAGRTAYLEAGWAERWKHFTETLYLPVAGMGGIIPQDDTFLSKPELKDIEKYRNSMVKQSILKDYSRSEVVGMQVLKQADLVMLFNNLPKRFPAETVRDNVRYYEARTLHDSSLSYCAHAEACAVIGDSDASWHFFKKALEIDLNDNFNDSTDGIHSASLGGILKCVLRGYAGIRISEDGIQAEPNLPGHWNHMDFYIKYAGCYHNVRISRGGVTVTREEGR